MHHLSRTCTSRDSVALFAAARPRTWSGCAARAPAPRGSCSACWFASTYAFVLLPSTDILLAMSAAFACCWDEWADMEPMEAASRRLRDLVSTLIIIQSNLARDPVQEHQASPSRVPVTVPVACCCCCCCWCCCPPCWSQSGSELHTCHSCQHRAPLILHAFLNATCWPIALRRCLRAACEHGVDVRLARDGN